MRVLLVEDDSNTAQSIELMLKSENFIVDSTDLGEDGLEIGKLYDYDIILLDLMQDGHGFKGYLPGGASGGILPAAMADIPLDFGTLEQYGCFIGSAAIVVLSDKDSMKDAAINLMRFFEDESCGQCTPCRVGTEKAVKLMSAPKWDDALLAELAQAMGDASICGLGQAAWNPRATGNSGT